MTFISQEFLFLLAGVLCVYYFLPHRAQNILLLAVSLFFYGWWDWRFLGLLLGTSSLDFIYAGWLDRTKHPTLTSRTRKAILIASIVGNLSVLGFFKYFNFFAHSLAGLIHLFHIQASWPMLNIILPLGISFYTFHEMSYTIDVYRGDFQAADNFFDYLLYVCFFPHLVAGPIQRANNLLPQIESKRVTSVAAFYAGAQLVAVGYFKKMVIADNLTLIVDPVFSMQRSSGAAVLLASYAFAIQIYCDFSGYTDIARGVARMLGIHIPPNFNLPYFVTNPRDFWRRWHISLSSWLKDYLFIPLGGSRQGKLNLYRNLMITMTLGGFWHGASWHFVVWGIYHGLLLCGYYILLSVWPSKEKNLDRSPLFWIKAAFFFQLTCLGWLIFRVDDLNQLLNMMSELCRNTRWEDFFSPTFYGLIFLALPLFLLEWAEFMHGNLELWQNWPVMGRTFFYLTMLYSVILIGSPVTTPFIYFQF